MEDGWNIVGIDLGTTNSVVAALIDGKMQVIREDGEAILPSVVGISTDGKVLVGQAAKNQLAAFPDRTIASVKRQMGQAVKLKIADQQFTPQEISAIILRRLKDRAQRALGRSVDHAVITVPAFFDENQRQATREAGILAGFQVDRIINEPTAASLVYHCDPSDRQQLIVYDLGGGTFDVSIVRVEAGVVEVLSSKGDTHLGGDDFDQLLVKHVTDRFAEQHQVDLNLSPSVRSRLLQACERAKCSLSVEVSTRIAEEFIAEKDGVPLHLDMEITRSEYERLIAALVDRTMECVHVALHDSKLDLSQVDELILVGGSTRTPLVQTRLREEFGLTPIWKVDPDLAVALGAATQGAMQSGLPVGPVLIDVATHTLGVAVLQPNELIEEEVLAFSPILHRNSPLPARYEQVYFKTFRDQKAVIVDVYQGESQFLEENERLGKFELSGLTGGNKEEDDQIIIRFQLNLNGILEVTATEKSTGLNRSLRINNALSQMTAKKEDSSKRRIAALLEDREAPVEMREVLSQSELSEEHTLPESIDRIIRYDSASQPVSKLQRLLEKANEMRSKLSGDNADDLESILGRVDHAMQSEDSDSLAKLEPELDDLLFYLES